MVTNIMLKGLGKVLDGVADGVAWIQEQPAYIKYILLTLVFIVVYWSRVWRYGNGKIYTSSYLRMGLVII